MEKAKIERINALAKKAKTIGLTEEETKERQELRQEYIKAFRANLKSMLDNIKISDEADAQSTDQTKKV